VLFYALTLKLNYAPAVNPTADFRLTSDVCSASSGVYRVHSPASAARNPLNPLARGFWQVQTLVKDPLCFHIHASCLYRNPFRMTSIQFAGCRPPFGKSNRSAHTGALDGAIRRHLAAGALPRRLRLATIGRTHSHAHGATRLVTQHLMYLRQRGEVA
jgi:hypothetical protein